ncbi:N-6 DNA methylase [Aminobacter carboxidus]|uniref:N-6 DNA methylase n=1 Tax=Aminobacter carboxidus TaxID=376165 RepID=A0ABR9GWU1_9HYPH|nr:N-6 DNA methylase [Aminobacter carboxidus]MBE1208149.1 N-6 DNA methylase [Aminobacter carboxidus]
MARVTKISESVLAVLSAASFDGPRMTLAGALDRKLYADTAKVIEAAGGKWNRAAKAHVFPEGDAADQVEPIILTGEIVRPQDMGQFDSPPTVVQRVVELADINRGMSVLEPSAGIGNLAHAADACGGKVTAFEVDEKRAAKLGNFVVHVADFLTIEPTASFNRVVMNPPFAPAQADIDHVLHALQFLKPDGRLVSVMSAGVMFRSSAKTIGFRALVDHRGGTISRLPEGSFRASGTDVNTCIVVIPGEAA